MSQLITLELDDKAYEALQRKAKNMGLSVAELVITSLHQQYDLSNSSQVNTENSPQESRQRLLRFAGAVSLGYATGIDNENIEADLAKAYGNEF